MHINSTKLGMSTARRVVSRYLDSSIEAAFLRRANAERRTERRVIRYRVRVGTATSIVEP